MPNALDPEAVQMIGGQPSRRIQAVAVPTRLQFREESDVGPSRLDSVSSKVPSGLRSWRELVVRKQKETSATWIETGRW